MLNESKYISKPALRLIFTLGGFRMNKNSLALQYRTLELKKKVQKLQEKLINKAY